MAKRARNREKDHKNPKRSSRREYFHPEDMDDDIDTFHKQRDIIPLDINDDDDGESIDDEEEPVFDDEDIDGDEEEEEEEESEDEDDSDETQFAAKLKRQQKYMKEKFGIGDDDIHDEEDKEDKKEMWGGKKPHYYGGQDYEGESSDDDALKEEEEEILRMQREKAKKLSREDFGLDNVVDESDKELTLEDMSVKGINKAKASLIKEVDNMDTFEEVKKDLNALSKEEQMDVVYSSAPELVGLLSELNNALEELDSRVNPILSKVKSGGITLEGGMRYLEVKQLLLLAYCQAITFYLLLKSEGQPARDHPVIARLVEIKGLLDKMKQLDGNLPSEVEEFLKSNCGGETGENNISRDAAAALASESVTKDYTSVTKDYTSAKVDVQEPQELSVKIELIEMEPLRDHENKQKKHKHKTNQVGVQSMEMLRLRAALEEKLKQRGVFSSFPPKAQKQSKSVNGRLETYDDFNDDAIDAMKGDHRLSNGHTSLLGSSKLSQLVSARPKVVSGDDDLPKRDDIGERRRKHEVRVLASAGVMSEDDAGHEQGMLETNDASDMEEDGNEEFSEDEFYREIKQKRDAKLAAKAEIYARNPKIPSLPETVEGKRKINYQIEKNKGLTRARRKDLKNPRKKYRTKHEKQTKRRIGQVREIIKPTGGYGGEASGINAGVSRSIRFGN